MYNEISFDTGAGPSFPGYTESTSMGECLSETKSVVSMGFSETPHTDDTSMWIGEPAQEKSKNMSVITCTLTEKQIIISADSRSSRTEPIGTFTFTDDYQKIVYVPKFRLVVASSGLNDFDGLTLKQLTDEISNQDYIYFIEELKQRLWLATRKTGLGIIASVCEFTQANNGLLPQETVISTIPQDGCILQVKKETTQYNLHSFGEVWATSLLSGAVFTDISSPEKVEEYLRIVLPQIRLLDNSARLKSTIGGPITIAKLSLTDSGTVEFTSETI